MLLGLFSNISYEFQVNLEFIESKFEKVESFNIE